MGSLLSTLFSYYRSLNALKYSQKNAPKDEQSNSSVESAAVNLDLAGNNDATETTATSQSKLESSELECKAPLQAPSPQAEPNTFHYQQPLSKRRSKPELRVYSPLAGTDAKLSVHEFIWKYGGKQVFLAGNFNNWNPSEIEMAPVDPSHEYHRTLVELDPTLSWEFKFIVDGVWRCSLDIATATDMYGNTNNIIYPENKDN